MSGGKDNQEPSMEEILSSIRRIIADEQDDPPPAAAKPAAAPIRKEPEPPPPMPEPEEDDEELELTEAFVSPPPPPPPIEIKKREEPARMPTPHDEGLVSGNTASASTSALARLSRAVSQDERPSAGLVPGVTIEQLVMDLLRPQLKEWLDEHLPVIVERVVEQEVKKLARRAELL